MKQSLAPLRHRGFRWLVTGQFASNAGDACYAVALPWYVLAAHGGVVLLGTVLAAYGIARTVALVAGGHASDRWRPWTVMMAADLVRVAVVGTMALAAAAGPARAAVLVPIAVVLGAGEGLFLPGSFAIIPTLLPGDTLQAANALSSAGAQAATLAGPALGGVLVEVIGPAPAFAVDAATFAISALTLAGVRAGQRRPALVPSSVPGPAGDVPAPAGPSPAASSPAAPSAADGQQAVPSAWSLLRSERVLQIILLVVVAANLGSGGFSEVALPALAHGPLHAGAGGYGGLIAAFAAGGLLGTLAAGQLGRLRRPAIAGSVAFLGEAVFMAAVPYLGSALAAGAALALFGALNGLGNVVMITLFQRWAPPELLGRLMGVMVLASFGIFPASVALGAAIVHAFGPALFFPVGAAALAVAIAAGLSQRRWRDLGAATVVAESAAAGQAATGG